MARPEVSPQVEPNATSAPESASDPAELGVLEAAALLRVGRLTSVELTDACLRRVDERNGGPPTFSGAPDAVNAWVRLYPHQALTDARAADSRLQRARKDGVSAPLLCGVPLGVKDLFGVGGRPLTGSSMVLEGNVAGGDAACLRALRDRGMVVLGHTHTHELAAGGTTDQVGNPWDLRISAGGSSGGSAAAVAARMVPAALGTDTCGSLRIPSACCGTSTVKPTHGTVSLRGVVPLAPSLDHAGPMARSVADCAALLAAMAACPEVTPLMPPPQPLGELPTAARPGRRPLEGMVLALTSHASALGWDAEVGDGFDVARRGCERLGATVVELEAPWRPGPEDLSAVLLTEMWTFHSRYSGLHDRYRPSVAEMVEAASGFTDAAVYLAAQERRAEGTGSWEAWFADNRVDAVLEPTLPVVPPLRGPGYERGHPGGAGDPLVALTELWNMTGMPVVSLPVTPTVGVSLAGPRGAEASLLQIGIDLQDHVLGVPSFPGAPA